MSRCKCGKCRKCYINQYIKNRRIADIDFRNKISDQVLRSQTLAILRKHHTDMMHDPERLSTEFMISQIGIKCKKTNEDECTK